MYAVCHERVYKEDFHKGGACVDSCTEMVPTDRASWMAAANAARTLKACKQLVDD